MNLEKSSEIYRVFKKSLALMIIGILLIGTLPTGNAIYALAVSTQNKSESKQVWLLDEGYLTLSKDKKSLIKVGLGGKETTIYQGPITRIWSSALKLYFINSESLAVMALDLKTLKWENVYYINDLNIAFAAGTNMVMSTETGLIWIDLQTKSETVIEGIFSRISSGKNCLYAVNESKQLCQIGWNGKVTPLGDIGDMAHYHLGDWTYIVDATTGKLKGTMDANSYRAVTDQRVIKIDGDALHLVYLEEKAQNNLKYLYGDRAKVLTFKMPFEAQDIQLQGKWLLVTDLKNIMWKVELSTLEKSKDQDAIKFKPLLASITDLGTSEDVKGILTFRGGPLRQNSAYGQALVEEKALKKIWSFSLPAGNSKWGGGAGWTGQPLLVQWSQKMKVHMNISDSYKNNPNFVEVIQASLNGNVYFADMATGKATRPPIQIENPVKGTPSVDSRGLPLLYVGDGIPCKKEAGFRIFSLIDQKELFFQKGIDLDSTRRWPAFDSSAIFNDKEDQLTVGGENGILYQFKLNAKYNEETGELTLSPSKKTYKAKTLIGKDGKVLREGIENSVAYYNKRYYFATNSGQVRCVDQNLNLLWEVNNYDDTDASVTIDIENERPVIYTASEVDLQGEKGLCRILKIDGISGKVLWKRAYTCYSKFGESPSNGGALATNIVGKNDIDNVVIFTLARCEKLEQGSIIALDKKTGKQVWRKNLSTYAWSSPVVIYDENGKSYILQNDHCGTAHLLEGISGKEVWQKKVDSYLEATPAVYNNTIVFSSRTGTMYGYQIF